ncbi:MAG: PEP-CTERM sorting domain-containing protein, partial [Thermoguttaceae bacterium]|nr:PEP-CTERM sorting domain-containing protein [Thermoguttaceae bacterium]
TLQIYTDAAGQVDAAHFLVSSGRLDMKEFFTGSLEVESGATMSPGNSVGTLTVDGASIFETAATLLLEVGRNEQGEIAIDHLIVNGDNGQATFASGAIVNIGLDPTSDLKGGDEFYGAIITANNADAIYSAVEKALTSYYFTDLKLSKDGNNIYLYGRLDPNAIPEPSTWALLALGIAGLMYWRKRKNA